MLHVVWSKKIPFPHKQITTIVLKNKCIVDTSAELQYSIGILKAICFASYEDFPILLDVVAGNF